MVLPQYSAAAALYHQGCAEAWPSRAAPRCSLPTRLKVNTAALVHRTYCYSKVAKARVALHMAMVDMKDATTEGAPRVH